MPSSSRVHRTETPAVLRVQPHPFANLAQVPLFPAVSLFLNGDHGGSGCLYTFGTGGYPACYQCGVASAALQALRTLAQTRHFAPGVVHLRELLGSLFSDGEESDSATDPGMESLRRVMERKRSSEAVALTEVAELIAPCLPVMSGLSTLQVEYVTTLASHDGLVKWIR